MKLIRYFIAAAVTVFALQFSTASAETKTSGRAVVAQQGGNSKAVLPQHKHHLRQRHLRVHRHR